MSSPWTTGFFGTPEYTAPEQIEGRAADVNSASDQFALAVIAYELLTGSNPGMAGRIVPPTGLPGQLDSVLARALARSNDERFDTVTELAAAFRAAVLPPPVVVAPPVIVAPQPVFRAEVGARGLRRSRRPRWGMRVGLAVTAGLVATLFFKAEPPASVSGSSPAQLVAPPIAQAPSAAPEPILAATAEPEVDARPAADSTVSVACAR